MSFLEFFIDGNDARKKTEMRSNVHTNDAIRPARA